MDFNAKHLKYIDYWIIAIIIGLAIFSYFGISSAKPDTNYAVKQLIWYGIGFLILIFMVFVDYELIKQYTYFFYGFGLVLLLGLFLFADETKGILGWYEFNGIKFQPAELMKIFTILVLARYLENRKGRPFQKFIDLYVIFLIVGIPFLLILVQPDLGTALVFFFIMLCMMLVYGVKFKHFAILGGIGGSVLFILFLLYKFNIVVFNKIIPGHQLDRLTSFIDPSKDPLDTGYQVIQSLIAVGSGQLTGVGLYQGEQGKNNWVPASHTDFIFSVIAEEHGFIGSSILILLLFLLIYRIVRIGITTEDHFGLFVTVGIVGMFIFTIFENIGMTLSIMPITGIPLPFISYGGSSLLTNFIAIGIVLNIGVRRKTQMF